MTRLSAPRDDEIEVTVFGPGVGEALAIHTGHGRWMLVDSCRDRTGKIPSLEYLALLGVDPSTSVDWILATHAHSDHVKGLAEMVETCRLSKVIVSAATSLTEFKALASVDAQNDSYGAAFTVFDEYRLVYSRLEERDELDRIEWMKASHVLPVGASTASAVPLKITGLGPSSFAETMTRQFLAQQLADIETQGRKGRILTDDPNALCVAVLVEIGNVQLLLGGDVEFPTDRRSGWGHVYDNFPIRGTVSMHKVPHHGSENAYCEDIWNDWLSDDCVNVITPFRRSHLPRDMQVRRMLTHGRRIFATARSGDIAASAEVRRVRQSLRDSALEVNEIGGIVGRVTYRISTTGAPTVTVVDPAFQHS